MKYKATGLSNWLHILVLIVLFAIQAVSLSASEAEETEEQVPTQQEEPVEPFELRNDRVIALQITEGEIKWMKTGKSEFLGILKSDSSGRALGGVLILASPNSAPNSPGAINYLSNELSENGWHTLSISVPEFNFSGPAPKHPDAKLDKAEKQSESDENKQVEGAKVDDKRSGMPDSKIWYKEQQTKNMEKLLQRVLVSEAELQALGGQYIIIAQGATAELLLELISSNVINPQGLITLDIQHPVDQRMSSIPAHLAKVTIPTLDVFNVPSSELAKKRKLKQKGNNYRQTYVPANGIHYKGSEHLLYKKIKGWLTINFSK